MDSRIPSAQGLKSPYVGMGLTPLALETTQRYLKQQQRAAAKPSCLKLVCFILIVITGFNTLFSVMMMYQNSQLIEENQKLIDANRSLIGKLFIMKVADGDFLSYAFGGDDYEHEVEPIKFAKMIDERFPIRKECPPCTTPKPNPVQPHKNPVSILNEKLLSTQNDGKASYDCLHTCLNPPIHNAVLTISGFPGKTWNGKGKSKADSKQLAAYRAIQELYSELENDIGEEYIPDESYDNTVCLGPNVGIFLLPDAKKSC